MNLDEFQNKINYQFAKKELLEEAFRHSSYVNEQVDNDLRDNERMEFLGDAVLNLSIGHLLMQMYPEFNEGDLSRVRASLVNEYQLSEIARKLDTGEYISLGKGEDQTNGRMKNSILADTFEAVIAAVYLDSGFEAVFKFIEFHFSPTITMIVEQSKNQDFKSQLQELVQTNQKVIPAYEVIEESGPDHNKLFKIKLTINDLTTNGTGRSKKLAEQDAAQQALEILNMMDHTPDSDE